MFTRISKEMSELYNEYNNIHIKYCCETNTHTIKIEDYEGRYVFYLNDFYPFQPPANIMINNTQFHAFCKITSPRFLRYMKMFADELKEIVVPHGSIALKKNWGPANTILEVMRELKNMQELKRRLVLYSLLDTIGTKYNLPEDIRIQEYI